MLFFISSLFVINFFRKHHVTVAKPQKVVIIFLVLIEIKKMSPLLNSKFLKQVLSSARLSKPEFFLKSPKTRILVKCTSLIDAGCT